MYQDYMFDHYDVRKFSTKKAGTFYTGRCPVCLKRRRLEKAVTISTNAPAVVVWRFECGPCNHSLRICSDAEIVEYFASYAATPERESKGYYE